MRASACTTRRVGLLWEECKAKARTQHLTSEFQNALGTHGGGNNRREKVLNTKTEPPKNTKAMPKTINLEESLMKLERAFLLAEGIILQFGGEEAMGSIRP